MLAALTVYFNGAIYYQWRIGWVQYSACIPHSLVRCDITNNKIRALHGVLALQSNETVVDAKVPLQTSLMVCIAAQCSIVMEKCVIDNIISSVDHNVSWSERAVSSYTHCRSP